MSKHTSLRANFGWLFIVLGLLTLIYWIFSFQPTQAGGPMALVAPDFIASEDAATEISAVEAIADEAGIAAYFNAGSAINLNNARSIFRTIESETESYIIGSVGVPDYDENHDIHVYIDSSGWIMAYLDDSIPTSRIFDWRIYDVGGTDVPTKLDTVLGVVASSAGAPVQPATYYHFSYPNATHLLLVAETESGRGNVDSFSINLPSSQNYYERSWSLAENESFSESVFLTLNGTQIAEAKGSGWAFLEGLLTASQLGVNSDHEFLLTIEDDFDFSASESGFLGLAIVYEVP